MSELLEKIGTLVAELRRRRVFRAAGLYLVGAWAVIEVSATVFPLLFLPEWATRALVVLAVLGLPVALVLSWAFDLTREGVRRTDPADSRLLPARARAGLVLLTVAATGVAGWGARGVWLAPGGAGDDAPILDPARVAVLYLDDHSEGGRLRYMADGLTEALIHELAQIEPLAVVSRNGVKPFRSGMAPLDSIARALRVGTVVEGSVEGDRDGIRATIQLIDTRSGAHLLSRQLRVAGGGAMELRDSLVTEAARTLGQALGRELEVERRRGETRVAGAWDRVQRALARFEAADTLQWRLGDGRTARRALEDADSLLAEAGRLDRAWARPLVLRARAHSELARLDVVARQDRDRIELLEGLQHADGALERDPGNAEAFAWRGILAAQLSWLGGADARDWVARAESDLRQAVALDPGNVEGWVGLADLLRARGDFTEAAVAAERALDADAFLIHAEQSILFTLSHIWLELEQLDRARRWSEEGRRRYPAVPAFAAGELALLAGAREAGASPDSAWALARTVEDAYGIDRWSHGHVQVAAVLARQGLADSARAVVRKVREGQSGDPWLDYYEANTRLQLGEVDRALDLLTAFIAAVPHRRAYIARDWWWRPLRDSERFQALVGPEPAPIPDGSPPPG